MVNRRADTLLPLELRILEVVADRGAEGDHGFGIAQRLSEAGGDSRRLTAHGTLYKALGRLRDRGLLMAEWEAPEVAEEAGRPRRRTYRISAAGRTAMRTAQTAAAGTRLGDAPA